MQLQAYCQVWEAYRVATLCSTHRVYRNKRPDDMYVSQFVVE